MPFRKVRGYVAKDRRGWWGKGRKCLQLKCVLSKTGAQSEGCPTGQVKRCARYRR